MIDSINLHAKFESSVLELLKLMNLGDTCRENFRKWTITVGNKYAFDVKYICESPAEFALIHNAAAALVRNAKRHLLHPVLVVSCALSERQRQDIEARFDITIMDRMDLIIAANPFKSVLANLEMLGLTLLYRGNRRNSSKCAQKWKK